MANWHKSLTSFLGGRNNRMASELLADDEAQTAQNLDLANGHLASLNDLGSTIATAASGHTDQNSVNWVWYAAGSHWIDPSKDVTGAYSGTTQTNTITQERRYALNDGNKSYFTRQGKKPHVITPTWMHPLGIDAVTGFTWSEPLPAGNLTGTFQYAMTFVTDNGLESNPMGFEWIRSLTSNSVDFSSIPTSPDPRVTQRKIWRTQANGQILYLRKIVDNNTDTTFTDGGDASHNTDAVLDLLQPLTWAPGGFALSPGIYTSDHSTPPPLSVMANTLHAVNDAVGLSGAGILFGAVGATVRWSLLGYPDYWPLVNNFVLPELVEAIISHSGTTYFFLAGGIYQATGTSDDNLSFDRTNALFGVMVDAGRTVKQTPYGMIFVAREGFAIFDGSSARIIKAEKNSASDLRALTINDAAYFNSKYYLFHSTGTMILDLSDGLEQARVTTTDQIIRCATLATITAPIVGDILRSGLGGVNAIQIQHAGTGFTAIPTLTVAAPTSGTTATATAYVKVDRVKMTNGGASYEAIPDVVFTSPPAGGRPAKATASLSGASVAAIHVTDHGGGYTVVPAATITGGGGDGTVAGTITAALDTIRVTNPGGGYGEPPIVTITAPPSGEQPARVTAIVTPTGYRWLGLAASATKLWRIGGAYINVPTGTGDTYDTTTDEYEIQTATTGGKWTRRNALNTARFNVVPVVIGSTIYLYGGAASGNSRQASLATMETNIGGAGVWSQTVAQTPGALCGYGAATDGTDLYLYGGYSSSSAPTAILWRYNVAGGTWTNLTTTTPAPSGSERGNCSMAFANGSLYIFGGEQTLNGVPSATVLIYNIATPAWTTDTNGPAAGFARRTSPAVGTYNNRIYLYGGRSAETSDGTALSDLWEYDPADATNRWLLSAASVVTVPPLARMGYAMIGSRLFIFGGSTADILTTGNLYSIDVRQLADNDTMTGIYVIKSGDNGAIKRLEGGSALQWTWRSKDFTSPRMGPFLTWTRMRVECAGTLTVRVGINGGAATTVKSITGASRATPQRFWLPSASSSKAMGQRLALDILGNAGATVHRIDIEGYADGDQTTG